MQKRIEMDKSIKDVLSSQEYMPKEICLRRGKYYPKEFISSKGHKSVVWKGVDEYSMPVAIKFATYEDYINRSYLEEASRAAKLRGYSQFAHFYDADIKELEFSSLSKIKFVCFCEECPLCQEGNTLEDYIQINGITPSFIVSYVKEMCQALNILKELDFRHDDLHSGNVMIATPKKGTLSKELTMKIIDMGSLKPYNAPLTKEKDDHGWFTEHLRILYNCMLINSNQRRKPLSLMDRRFRREILPLIDSMMEEDREGGHWEIVDV